MVVAQSLFKTLKSARPHAQIDVLAPAWSAPLLARMPEVHQAVAMPLEHGQLGLVKRYRLGRELAARHYEQAIILPRSFKAALVPWFARVPRRTGYLARRYGLTNDVRPLNKKATPRLAQRYIALGLKPGASPPAGTAANPSLNVDANNARRMMGELGLQTGRPAIGLMPGAEYGPAKQWPLEHYAELARRLSAEGMQIWIFGSQKDRAAAERIATQAGCGVNLCGRTRLEDAIDLIAQVTVAVSNDSGLMHVAAAVGVPVVGLYGSSTPEYTPPLSERATVLYLHIECSPCFERNCPYGHFRCLRDIPVERVLAEVRKYAATGPEPWKASISF
jgi:heptosyltransferase-2